MKHDTKQRIEEYNRRLPKLREKLMAMVVLLVIGAIMATTVSFAWVTLSVNPEVSGVNTSIASNGNLEIALATGPQQPGATQIGDGDKAMLDRNITWGNLINLSDPAYGLDKLVLRPAQLNTGALLTSPLYGATYDEDGRKTGLNSDFGYAIWNPEQGEFYTTTSDYGVRVISSVTKSYGEAEKAFNDYKQQARNSNDEAGSIYSSIASNDAYLQSLTTMMGLYMTDRLDDDGTYKNPTFKTEDVRNLAAMYGKFKEAFEKEAEALALLLNVQLYAVEGSGFTPYTADKIFALNSFNGDGDFVVKDKNYIKITKLKEFQKDYQTICTDYEKLVALIDDTENRKWSDSGMNTIVNNLVNVGTCTVTNKDGLCLAINSIGARNATNFLGSGNVAHITNGILYRFEQRVGSYIDVKNLSITVSVKRSFLNLANRKVTADVQTSAKDGEVLFWNDLDIAKYSGTESDAKGVADDTYGLSVDFWVRTNAQGGYLTLEGNVLTKTETVRATTRTPDGTEVELFTITETQEVPSEDGTSVETVSYDYDLYKLTVDGTDTWYQAITHAKYELPEGTEPTPKMTEITTVVGYKGANRVWNDGSSMALSVNSTTQGSGSCYVYYADTPEDMKRSLVLLESMKVVFVDSSGKALAFAEMDTENYYAENGKVIVPMVLDANAETVGTDGSGNAIRAIMPLEQNVATRISAIVYLDGTKLNNDAVLSNAEIDGQINIQFGTTATLSNVDDDELKHEVMTVSASLEEGKTEFDYDTATEPMTTGVTVSIDGDDKDHTVKAFFIRQINSTQGSRESVFELTKNAEGKYVGSYTFTSPGTYILRTAQIDGIDYDISLGESAEPLIVVVNGYAVTDVRWNLDENATIMTAASSYSERLQLEFKASDESKMPRKVQGRFERAEDKSVVNVDFAYDATSTYWVGTANFLTSGNYTLQYVVLDGKYQELPAAEQKSARVLLGMKALVDTTSPLKFKYDVDEMIEGGYDKLNISVEVLDNTGEPIEALDDVVLYYREASSSKEMTADVIWNAGSRCYEGEFDAISAKAGVFKFSSVTIDANVITVATSSPTFTIQSPEPPTMTSENIANTKNEQVTYEFAPNNDSVFLAYVDYSNTALVYARIFNTITEETFDVEGFTTEAMSNTMTDGVTTMWRFTIPNSNSSKGVVGRQDGNWQLQSIMIWDYYDADGNYVEFTGKNEDGSYKTKPMEFNLASHNIEKEVVTKVNIVFENQDKDFTGAFLEEYTISGMTVKVTDAFGESLKNTVTVSIYYNYDGKSNEMGGYTSSAISPVTGGDKFDITFTGTLGETTFAQKENRTIQYAGRYTPDRLTLQVGTKVITYSGTDLPANTPKFTVSSTTPTVKIKGISPTGTIDVDTSGVGNGHTSTTVPAWNETSATVYFKCSRSGSGSTCDPYRHNYSRPSVTIELSGIGNATQAELSFGEDILLYDGTTQTTSYIWTSNGTCARNIGYYRNKTAQNDDKTPAGTLTANTLVLKYNSETYYVSVPTITISNPY